MSKEEEIQLHQKTKDTIEGLTDEQVTHLLRMKWIVPLTDSLGSLPGAVVNDLSKKVSALVQKYEVTLNELEEDIEKTEREFCAMLDDLTGSEFDMKGIAELKKLLGGC